MNNPVLLLLVVVVLVVVAGGLWFASRRRKSAEIREQFGPEYDRTVREYGATGPAERALIERTERVQQLHVRALSEERSSQYAAEWHTVQSRFVDDPQAAIGEADHLVTEVMQARGYPMGDFEQRAADVSVDHPHVVENYRAAHAIANRTRTGEAATEDLRQAMVHYRALFAELIDARQPATSEAR
ncbi:MAG TPA: hypothetical protein VGQ62_06045 [Chloroflexota bacterium]|nr:hypothetical protein [Chloroflexota bacterium]